MNAVRTGYNTMWRCAGPYMTRKNQSSDGRANSDMTTNMEENSGQRERNVK